MSKMKEVPNGIYNVKILKMELVVSKGDPMVSIWFKIVSDGEYKNSIIFMNQVITQGFQIHIVNELLRMMVSEMGTDAPVIEFKTFKQYGNLIMDVFEAIDNNFEFELESGTKCNVILPAKAYTLQQLASELQVVIDSQIGAGEVKNINKGSVCHVE